MRKWMALGAAGLSLVLPACDQGGGDGTAALIKRGGVVYDVNCTACHAREPAKPGPVGPAIAGASLELLEAKVVRNTYPDGYTPKRDTQAMIPLKHLAPEIPALHAYLGSVEQGR